MNGKGNEYSSLYTAPLAGGASYSGGREGEKEEGSGRFVDIRVKGRTMSKRVGEHMSSLASSSGKNKEKRTITFVIEGMLSYL
jgi:hypothetical protein